VRRYIADNDITDFNISSTVFSAIQSLVAFESDLPDASAVCTDGAWQTAHNCTFCVSNGTTTAGALCSCSSFPQAADRAAYAFCLSTVAASSGGSNALLIGLVAAGCALVVVVVALVCWHYFAHKKSQRMSSSKNDFYSQEFGDTLNFDDTQVQVDPVFLNDPVIVTNRLDHKLLKLGKCISKGGFGVVFLGEYKGRRVAIKKIRPDRSVTTAEIELFLKEIILMAVLYHPRVVEFIGVAWENLRHLSAVTEFMDNGDLREVLHGYKLRGERLSWESHKATIALHIAEGLAYLHGLKPKVIHRDLKSKNVLLNMYLEAKLSDFGISRMRYLVETHMTAGVGTSFWIAPEVLLGRDYDEAADIFSFGVVLSEIDTDDYPYWNDENTSNRGRIQEAEILSLVAEGKMRPTFSDDCPKAILDLADCCLQKDPEDRPTAAEIVVILEHMIHASERSSSSLQSGVWSVTSSDVEN
jgi:tRNA A-37 threonylcarbamoyl transferase component Bud32